MSKRNPKPTYARTREQLGDPVLLMLEPEEDEGDFWYDFLHLDWKEVLALIIVAAWMFYTVYTFN